MQPSLLALSRASSTQLKALPARPFSRGARAAFTARAFSRFLHPRLCLRDLCVVRAAFVAFCLFCRSRFCRTLFTVTGSWKSCSRYHATPAVTTPAVGPWLSWRLASWLLLLALGPWLLALGISALGSWILVPLGRRGRGGQLPLVRGLAAAMLPHSSWAA